MPWMAAAAVAAPIVGGLVGNLMSAGDKASAKKAMKQAVAELQAAGYPPDVSKEIIYQQFQQVGILTPELEEELNLAASEVAAIQEDPELRDAQLSALEQFRSQSRSGLGPEERAALNQIRNEVQRDSEAKRQQIVSDMQRRGMGGSGNELMAQLQASQGAADLASQQGDSVSAMLAQRIREGAQNYANTASGIRSQDFDVNQARSQALDQRNQFLYQNSADRQARNVSSLNAAQAQNLAEQQRVADANIQQANAEKLRQNEAQKWNYEQTMDRAKALANAYTGQQQSYNQMAQNTANSATQIGSGAGTALAALANKKK